MNKDIPEEVLFDISMEVYDKYNYQIATMYDYLGEIYTLQDIKDMEELEEKYENQLIQDYLDGKRIYTDKDITRIRKCLKGEEK